uniref:Uncharacterized protein n=1 Tax=Arion vulgaris TaxID=1028688 RepID=A0A0B7BP94_9EUPU
MTLPHMGVLETDYCTVVWKACRDQKGATMRLGISVNAAANGTGFFSTTDSQYLRVAAPIQISWSTSRDC